MAKEDAEERELDEAVALAQGRWPEHHMLEGEPVTVWHTKGCVGNALDSQCGPILMARGCRRRLLPLDDPESINATLEDCAQRERSWRGGPLGTGWEVSIETGSHERYGRGPTWQAALQRAYLAAREATDG